MKNILADILIPLAVAGTVAATRTADFRQQDDISPLAFAVAAPDTVLYPADGWKRGWSPEEYLDVTELADSLKNMEGVVLGEETDGFDLEDEGAEEENATDVISFQLDTLLHGLDSVTLASIRELELSDSSDIARNIYDHWYSGLSNRERRKEDREQMAPVLQAYRDSLDMEKEMRKAYKDSVFLATPRILKTYFLPDSMQYKRVVNWTHDRDFHNLEIQDSDKEQDFNYRFNDYPFLRKDVNATWLGVAGSPVLYNNFFKRTKEEGVTFYETLEPWTYSPATLPMYNTKTPYTELAYDGTLLESEQTASHNIHVLTTQNILPEWNLTLMYDRFGGEGPMSNEKTANKSLYAYTSYVGEKYLLHAGYISNNVMRNENGGAVNLSEVRDTTIDAREIQVYLNNASTKTVKKTVFLDQQYRIPMTFLLDLFKKKEVAAAADTASLTAVADTAALTAVVDTASLAAVADTMSTADVTTAFIGHSSEFTRISRVYDDNMAGPFMKDYYDKTYINPSRSHDTLGVTKINNKVFMRLQPWAQDAIVSKLDVGIGEDIYKYATFDPYYLHSPGSYLWTSTYVYAGVQGSLREYFKWNASGHYSLLGDEAGDFDLGGNVNFRFYPFRKERTSPVSLDLHFRTSLDEPEYYVQHMKANHFQWDNSFSKISTTKAGGQISVPHWKLNATLDYALLVNNIYYDRSSLARQNTDAMSILSATLDKGLALFNFLHLDHRALFQLSSNQEVVPLPKLSLNARYYAEFGINNDALRMQLGANIFYYTSYKLQRWNPDIAVFYNQTERTYGNAPYIDLFANMKWQDVSLFVKWENAGMGWPLDHADYFSADGNIRTPRIIKIGIFWPFHPKPGQQQPSSSSSGSHSNAGGGMSVGRNGMKTR